MDVKEINHPFVELLEIKPDGGELIIRTGDAPTVFDPYAGFQYTALTPKSFVELVRAKGKQEHAVIFMHGGGFSAILDDTVTDRPQDVINYGFAFSTQFEEWREVLTNDGDAFKIKELADFLKRREPCEIMDADKFLYAVQNFKYVSNITGDFTFDDRNNYVFSIKVNDAEGTVRFPAVINAYIEIFRGSGFVQDIPIEVEIVKPKNPGEEPLFLLSCPTFERYRVKAAEREFEELRNELDGWLVAEGQGGAR
ncbi:hypothetical protein FACS1894216_02250 [Synergistales bacterium]|nr:hypothetical protein FACS1894216_02250 [Synergistales bacterium]